MCNLALKSGGGQVLELYWHTQDFNSERLVILLGQFLDYFTKMGFLIFLITSSTWYTYLHIVTQTGQTVLEKNYFWKVFLLELEERWKYVFLLENVLDVLLSKALKRKKKLPPISENVNLLNKCNPQYESLLFKKWT